MSARDGVFQTDATETSDDPDPSGEGRFASGPVPAAERAAILNV